MKSFLCLKYELWNVAWVAIVFVQVCVLEMHEYLVFKFLPKFCVNDIVALKNGRQSVLIFCFRNPN